MTKRTIPQIIPFMAIALLIVSCATEPTQTLQKSYSSDTQKEFEAIEKNDLRISPPYRPTIKPTTRPAVVLKEPVRGKEHGLTKDTHRAAILDEKKDVSQLSAKGQERLQEINQNLAYFCMKHRKKSTFRDEEDCLAYTRKVLSTCEKNHKLINTVMVNCIKDRLKKRQ